MTRPQRRALIRAISDLTITKAKTNGEIESDLDILVHDLTWILNQDHIPHRIDTATQQLVLDLYVDGVPYKEIMFRCDVSDEYIRRATKKAGIRRRNKYPASKVAPTKK